jgi:Gpi18-like mannosyltransferase
MEVLTFRQRAVYTVLLFVMLLLLVPRSGHGGDLGFWQHWAVYIFEHGLGNVYQLEDNNYNPFYHYILWLYGASMGSLEKLYSYIHWLKGYTLVFDFAGAFWAASLVPERSRRFGLALLLLFNIAYLYNTLVWIQVDAIYSFFCFGAVVLAAQRRPVASMLCYVFAFSAKTQAIIFLPPLLLLWAPQWWHRPRKLVQGLAAGTALATLILAPFIWWSWENYVPRIIEINQNAAGTYPSLSLNAYNLWYLLPVGDPSGSDKVLLGGLPCHVWGLLLFCGFSALALWPLLAAAVRSVLVRPAAGRTAAAPSMALVLLCSGTIPLVFAFFNTQMHERYWHAALLFMAAYGFVRRDYLPYILVSCAYFLNLEAVLKNLQLLKYGVLLFMPEFIAGLFGLAILVNMTKIYLMVFRERRLAAALAPEPTMVPVVAAAV